MNGTQFFIITKKNIKKNVAVPSEFESEAKD